MKLIIDTDPGIDDAMAIFYAHGSPEIELIGLTSVFGNVNIDMATRNALRLVDKMETSIPVAHGTALPWEVDFEPSLWVHGPEGFGDIKAETPSGKAVDENAVDFLIEKARENPGTLTIAPIGPLTNIANAIQKDPEFINNVKQFLIMGGAVFVPGNITKHAEANIYHDPHAAEVVLASGANITLIGLDVTLKTTCGPDDFARVAKSSPKLGSFLRDMSHFYINFYRENEGLEGCGLHDPVAVMAGHKPEYFTAQSLPIEVVCDGQEIGKTRIASDNRKPISVLTDVQAPIVVETFLSTLERNP